MTLGEKLKKARKEAGFSQEQLADKLCVSRQAVTKWESDKGMPDIGNLKAIASLLNISIDYLLDDENKVDQLVIKEPINLDDYEKSGRLRCRQDAVVFDKFKDADIVYPLMREKKLTKVEFWLDLFTLPGIFDFAYQMKDRNEYYLVEKNGEQYFVSVSKEFIESRKLSSRIDSKKFVIGEIKFKKAPYKF